VMISTFPAIPFLPNLLVLSVPSQPAQLKPGMIYLVHCTQYTLSLTHLGSPLDTSKPTSRATLLGNPWCSEPYTGDGKIVREEEVIVGVYDEEGNRIVVEGISRNITERQPKAGGSFIPLHRFGAASLQSASPCPFLTAAAFHCRRDSGFPSGPTFLEGITQHLHKAFCCSSPIGFLSTMSLADDTKNPFMVDASGKASLNRLLLFL